MIHLDTNFVIQALVPGSAAEGKLQASLVPAEDLGISTVAWSEFLCGPPTPQDEALAQTILAAVLNCGGTPRAPSFPPKKSRAIHVKAAIFRP